MSTISPREYEPGWVPPGDAAGEEPRLAPGSGADSSPSEPRLPAPEASGSLDTGGIHWNGHSDLGLDEPRRQADAKDRTLEAPDAPE